MSQYCHKTWREASGPVFETWALSAGELRPLAVGRLLLATTHFTAQRAVRGRHPLVTGEFDHYMLQLFTAGAVAGESGGRPFRLSVGDIGFRDLTRPFDTIGVPSETTALLLPRQVLDRSLGAFDLHGCVLPAHEPTTRLLAGFMASLSAMAPTIGGLDTADVEAATIELIVSIFSRKGMRLGAEASSPSRALRAQVMSFIDAHLAEPSLTPEVVRRRFQLSRAYLYRLFAQDGGVASVIRDRRLDVAYRELSGGGRSITTLAHDLGFSTSSQFARAFRTRFKCRPSDVTVGDAAA